MEEKYIKAITCITDAMKGINCVNLSMGARNKEDFSWIVNNINIFKEEAVRHYNEIILSILNKEKQKLFIVIQEQKDTEFTAVEKHAGIWHQFKGIPSEDKSKDFYLNEKTRYAYAELHEFNVGELSLLQCGDLVFVNNAKEIERISEKFKDNGTFDSLYDKGLVLANFRDLWTDGNSLVFYSKNSLNLKKIVSIAQENGFALN